MGNEKFTPKPTGNTGEAVTYNYYGDFNYRPNKGGIPWDSIGQVATVLSTVFMAIFTGALVCTSRRQWEAISRQTDTLDKALAETTKAADAAMKSADAAVSTSIPYAAVQAVALTDLEMLDTDPVADPVFEYRFANFGKTPALITEMCFEYHIGPQLPELPTYNNRMPFDGMIVVAAEHDTPPFKHSWKSLFDRYFTQQDFDPIRSKHSKLFIYGFMEYSDVFATTYTTVGFAFFKRAMNERLHVITPREAPAFVYRRSHKR